MNWNINYRLFLLFLLVFSIRLYLSFQSNFLSSDESYFHVRQVENIITTWKPLFNDPLSWNGGKHHFFATFHYIASFFALFISKEVVFKLLPQLFASLIMFPIYLIIIKLVKNKNFALIGALIAQFIPVFFSNTVNVFTPFSFSLFLFFSLINLFINLENRINWYLVLLIISTFSHPMILVFVFGLVVYSIFSKIEGFKLDWIEKECIWFSLFFPLWIYFIFYREELLLHSKNIVWQNIPQQILDVYFKKLTLFDSIYNVGAITLIFGLYTGYVYLLELKDKKNYFIFSLIFVVAILLWQKMIAMFIGGAILGILLSVLSAQGLSDLSSLLENTKISKYKNYVIFLVLVVFLFTMIIPSYNDAKYKAVNLPSQEQKNAFYWINSSLPSNSIVIALPDEGNYLNRLANAKNVIDSDFLLKNSDQVYNDVRRIFVTRSETEATELMSSHKADYLLVSKDSKRMFNLEKWGLDGSDCFEKIYENASIIYKKVCRRVVDVN